MQGLVALVSANPALDQSTFSAYTRNFRRGRENLRRVYLVRDDKIVFSDRAASSAGSFTRVEDMLAPATPIAAAAVQKNAAVMMGPFKTTEGDDALLYARPIFVGGDVRPSPAQFWGFAGVNIDRNAVICPLGLCDEPRKYRMAVRLVVHDVPQAPFVGDAALFEPNARAVLAESRIPGVRIELAAVPTAGWIESAPRRWMIRGIGGAIALFAGVLVLMLASGRPGQAVRTRMWAAAGSTGVLLLVLGLAAVLDRLEGERTSHITREDTIGELQAAAARSTHDISDDVAVIQNLTTFVEADPNFSEDSFQRYAARIRQLHPDIVSLQLARNTVTAHVSPSDSDRVGLDLRQLHDEAAMIEPAIATGKPILSGPVRVGAVDTFIYRRPIYLGDGTPSRDRFWGFATIQIARDAMVCPLGVCAHPPKYRYALRLVVGETPRAPFDGDAAMFAPGNDAAKVAVLMPGARLEMAAAPILGWSGATGLRWLIWIVAIPLALLASGRLLIVFFELPAQIIRVWVGLLVVLGGLVLALLPQEIDHALDAIGLRDDSFVKPATVTLIAFAFAYTINSALSAFVWPQPAAGHVDSLQRAPSILRHFIAVLLYATASLWAAAFAFNLDLRAVGFTSGAVGIIVGFATQRLIMDFFSGVMLGVERPYAIGDWVEVTTGGKEVRGVIYEMTWRTTLIRNANFEL